MFTLNQKESALSLEVKADDMKQGTAKTYYAIGSTQLEAGNEATNGGKYKLSENMQEIAQLTATKGTAGDIYECDYTITITPTGTMYEALATTENKGDLVLSLATDGDTWTLTKSTLDLKDITTKETVSGKLQIDASSGDIKLKAGLALKNDAEKPQNYLAGTGLSVSIVTSISDCTLQAAGD